MSSEWLGILLGLGIIFIPCAALVAWIVSMENEKFLQRIDQKIASEIRRRKEIDEEYGIDPELPDLTRIRHDCKTENRYLFLIMFLASLISFFGGSIFILRSP